MMISWRSRKGKISPEYTPISTPRYIDKGSIMQVEPDSGHLGGSIIIVLVVSSDNRLQCLRLCRHKEKQGRAGENAFWQTHSYIFDPKQSAIKGFADGLGQRPHHSIKADLHEEFELLPKCFINYDHTWTAGGPHAKLREVGTLAEGEFKLVIDSYRKTLDKMHDWADLHGTNP